MRWAAPYSLHHSNSSLFPDPLTLAGDAQKKTLWGRGWVMGRGVGWNLFFLNFLRALLEPSPKSAAGSNLGASRGPKMPPRAQSLSSKQNLEPGSLDCAPDIQGLGAGPGLLWAVTPSFLGLGCRVIISLTKTKAMLTVGKLPSVT